MSISFPGESPEYRVARNRLLQQEVELRRATEAVAAARRSLPPGGVIPQDYVFHRQQEVEFMFHAGGASSSPAQFARGEALA